MLCENKIILISKTSNPTNQKIAYFYLRQENTGEIGSQRVFQKQNLNYRRLFLTWWLHTRAGSYSLVKTIKNEWNKTKVKKGLIHL